jgi:hypothetical protein
MIPYDDLVAALSAWRARQGLPVTMSGAEPAAPVAAAPAPGSGPRSAAPRGTPPGAPQSRAASPTADAEEVDAALLDEDGADYELSFGGPTRAGDGDAAPARAGKRKNDEW